MGNAVEVLWEQYSRRLGAFIRGRVADEAEAEDILQEVFLRIHRHLCCVASWDKPGGWVFQIARNLIVDHYRGRRETVEVPEDLPAESPEREEDPRDELALSLRQMVDALPEQDREALVLTEYEGLSQVELARKLGISLSGAKSRVQRARARLRDVLLRCCHFELDRRGRVIDYYKRCCCCHPAPAGR
ncbi:MAG TPA: RNA polymerase sigma factor SigZ [Spirochaetia bacterium]|nr:RNA polymerase sigma factor SigZ [Spirochaetia bacterium]